MKFDKASETYKIKLADFGIGTIIPKDKSKSDLFDQCGSPCYVAPEILRGQGYNEKCDIFSVGSVCFNLLSGLYLFNGEDLNSIVKKNRECNLSHTY